LGPAQQLVEAQLEGFLIAHSQHLETLGNEFPHKLMEVPVAVEEAPVEPAHLVVLAVGVAVALLRATHFVAHLQHRRTDRCEQDDEEILYLAPPHLLDSSVGGRTLDPTIPGEVGSWAVAVSFRVRLVVLAIVRNKIVQRETVVAGDKIDALFGLLPFAVTKDVGLPSPRCASSLTAPLSPFAKQRISSRNRPFHSFQLSP